LGAKRRRRSARGVFDLKQLDGEQHDIGHAEPGCVIAGIEAHRIVAARPFYPHASRLDRGEVRPACQGRDVLTRLSQQSAEIATDAARSDDRDAHGVCSPKMFTSPHTLRWARSARLSSHACYKIFPGRAQEVPSVASAMDLAIGPRGLAGDRRARYATMAAPLTYAMAEVGPGALARQST
jgi:hypothetical protein